MLAQLSVFNQIILYLHINRILNEFIYKWHTHAVILFKYKFNIITKTTGSACMKFALPRTKISGPKIKQRRADSIFNAIYILTMFSFWLHSVLRWSSRRAQPEPFRTEPIVQSSQSLRPKTKQPTIEWM